MTTAEREVKNAIKMINERIARIGRKFGKDSLIYEQVIKKFTKALPPSLQAFLKLSSSGHLALDQTLKTVGYILGTGRLTALLTAGERIISLTEYNNQLRTAMKFEELFSDFEEEVEDTEGYTKRDKDKIYSQVKEAVLEYKRNYPYADSDPYSEISGLGRVPTYWELYKSFCKHEGLNYMDWIGSTAELASPTRAHGTKKQKEDAAKTAEGMRDEEEVDLYDNPRG